MTINLENLKNIMKHKFENEFQTLPFSDDVFYVRLTYDDVHTMHHRRGVEWAFVDLLIEGF